MSNSQGFIDSIHNTIRYWDNIPDCSPKQKMEGLAHSILCMLDGVSGNFSGNIHSLAKEGGDFMFHEMLWDKHEPR